MFGVEYYTQRSGRQPAKAWIDNQDATLQPSIDKRLDELATYGPELAKRGILEPIEPDRKERRIKGLYELRHRQKQWRIAVYYCQRRRVFLLLCGWRKTQGVQKRDVRRAKRLAREYLENKGAV